MDKQTEKRLDTINEDEVRRGYRIKTLPEALQTSLAEEGLPVVRRIRFTRSNPARRRKIAEIAQRQYQRDIRNPDVLSHAQLLALVTERGEWNEQMTKDMQLLQDTVNRRMGLLYFGKDDQTSGEELWQLADKYREVVRQHATPEDQHKVLEVFNRWVDSSPQNQAYYDATHAVSQGRQTYSAEWDLQQLLLYTSGLELRELLESIDKVRERLLDLLSLQQDREKLSTMQIKYAKIFSDSAEQRRDNAEEMARMYFTTEAVDEQDKPLGPLTGQFDALYDFPEDVVQWLLLENYFFQNGIPEEAREYLESLGFLTAARESTETASPSSESAASAESPAPPNSKVDSAVSDTTAVGSLG